MKENLSDFSEAKNSSVRALKESEEKFRMDIDNANDAIFIHTFDGRMLEVNQTACERLGYSKEELLKLTPMEIDTPEYYALYNERVVELQKNGSFMIETAHVCKDGTVIPIELSTKIILHEGKPAILSIARDITKRKSAGQKLNNSEEKYRFITENINDLIVILNEDYEYEYINEPVHKKLMGYSKEDLLGKSALNFIHPDDINYAIKALNKGFSVGEGLGEVRIKNKFGAYIWLEIKGRVFITRYNKKKGLIISRDISERKISEQKLRESEEKYRNILENLKEAYFEIDLSGNYNFVNKFFYLNLGYTKDEVIAINFQSICKEETAKKLFKIYNEVYATEIENPYFEFDGIKKNGEIIRIECSAYLRRDSNGNKIGFFGLAKDITKRKIAEQKLKESEEKYRLISENARDVIGVLNRKFEIEYVNEQAVLTLMGYTLEDIIGKSGLSFVHPDDVDRAIKSLNKGFEKVTETVEIRFRHKKGHYIWFEATGKVFKNNLGEEKGAVVLRDISERKKAEQTLKESEEKYRDLFEKAPYSIVLSSPEGIMLDANETTVKIFGFQKDEIIGNNFLNLGIYSPRHVRKFVKRFLAMKKGKEIPPIELQVKKKDGNLIWITYQSLLIEVENQLLIETIIQDITDRKLIEQQLIKSEEEYRLITENANDLIALFNQKLRYIYINEAVHERFLGYSKRDLIGKNLGLFIHPDDIKYMFDVIRENWKKGEGNAILRFKKSDGTYIWLEVRGVTSKSIKGELLGVTISRDITERREYEKKLQESEEKYQMAYNRASFYKDLFAHDINNILQIINSSSELILHFCEDSKKSEKVQSLADGIRAQVMRGAKLVSNVQAFSEIEDKDTPFQKVEILEVLNESIDFIKNNYLEKEIKIQIDFKKTQIFILANFFLKEIFDNILLNAIKHNNKSIVEILIRGAKEKRKNKNYFKIEFLDNGIGIPKDKKNIIFKKKFKPYQRLKGMGLGLSLVKEIMRKYNGKIRVEDKVKGDYTQGSNFILLFPELL